MVDAIEVENKEMHKQLFLLCDRMQIQVRFGIKAGAALPASTLRI